MSSQPVDPAHVDPQECDRVTLECPVEASIYGYYPSLPANAFFVALFGICFIGTVFLGIRHRTWTYLLAMTLATVASTIGYAGRILLHSNPYDTVGFEIQICCLTFSPALNSAAIYLMLKHIVRRFGREWSRLRPKYYTWGFISADIAALVLQAAGGGLAATSDGNNSRLGLGEHIMITGIAWQVLTLLIFGSMVADYIVRRWRSATPLADQALATINDRKFRAFAVALTLAYFLILIRCVYRIAEMANGWRNPIMQDEGLFIGLDSILVGVATVLQTVLHPGFCFNAITEPESSSSSSPDEKQMNDSSGPQVV